MDEISKKYCFKIIYFYLNTTEKSNLQSFPFLGDMEVKRFDKTWKNACQDAGIGVRQY